MMKASQAPDRCGVLSKKVNVGSRRSCKDARQHGQAGACGRIDTSDVRLETGRRLDGCHGSFRQVQKTYKGPDCSQMIPR